MEVLDENIQVVSSQENEKSKISKQDFEEMWKKAISGDEFMRRVQEHIEKLYN
ncbi:MAG: hypothetical protein LBE82_13220 [Chitinophagaceae bacterium]|jgi:hypothetical protein|nr:hypothetical protein [Chitinophagaceae bacterium]